MQYFQQYFRSNTNYVWLHIDNLQQIGTKQGFLGIVALLLSLSDSGR